MSKFYAILLLVTLPALAASFPAKIVRVLNPEVLVVQASGQEKTVVLQKAKAEKVRDLSEPVRKLVEKLVLEQQVSIEPKSRDSLGRSVVLLRLADGRVLNDLLDGGKLELVTPGAKSSREIEKPASRDLASLPEKPSAEVVYTVSKKMIDEAEEVDLLTLVAEHAPRLLRDNAGNPVGMTATNISSIPLAPQLGFLEGDIIRQVNGIRLESEMQIFTLVPQFEDTKDFTVDLLRDGKPQRLKIKLP